jgi:hypothetical protein
MLLCSLWAAYHCFIQFQFITKTSTAIQQPDLSQLFSWTYVKPTTLFFSTISTMWIRTYLVRSHQIQLKRTFIIPMICALSV